MITPEINIVDIERHCNNKFNGDHPPEFLALAARILAFRNGEQGQPKGVVSETVGSVYSWKAATVSGIAADWTQVFKNELALYKRARFI